MFRVVLFFLLFPVFSVAQTDADPETLASIRSELVQLYSEIEALKVNLEAAPATDGVARQTGPVTVRIDALEGELRAITGRVEQMQHRISKIVEDGTRRIGDLEFRLVELEGGDISALGETPLLGGQEDAVAAIQADGIVVQDNSVELAVSEEQDFETATQSLGDGDYANAVLQFGQFLTDYPGGPLGPQALFHLGEAHEALGQHKEAARSFLDSFSAQPGGSYAPQALMKVGVALGALGKVDNACQTFDEVLSRYPDSTVVELTLSNSQRLGCS